MACHTADGGGLIGPNMCDDYYIHGGTYADSLRVVVEGEAPEISLFDHQVRVKIVPPAQAALSRGRRYFEQGRFQAFRQEKLEGWGKLRGSEAEAD